MSVSYTHLDVYKRQLLNGGEIDGRRYLSKETCQLFTTSVSVNDTPLENINDPIKVTDQNLTVNATFELATGIEDVTCVQQLRQGTGCSRVGCPSGHEPFGVQTSFCRTFQ